MIIKFPLFAPEEETSGSTGVADEEEVAGEEETEVEGETGEEGEEPVEGEEAEEALSPEDQKEATRLYKILNDPDRAKIFLRTLMAEEGLLVDPKPGTGETKPTEAKQRKAIREIVKEKLGDKLAFLADNFSDAIEAVIEQQNQDVNEKLSSFEKKELEREVKNAYNKVLKGVSPEDRNKVEVQLVELSTKYPPGKNIGVEEYIRDLYSLLQAKGGKGKSDASVVQRVLKTQRDTPSRLGAGGRGKSGTQAPKEAASLKDAVRMAAASIGPLKEK